MQVKSWLLAVYTLCNVLLVIDVNVSAATNSNGSSTPAVSLQTALKNGSLDQGFNVSKATSVPTFNKSTSTLASGTTDAMSTLKPNSSQTSVTPTGFVQTTLSNISSHGINESTATPTAHSTAGKTLTTAIATLVPKSTQMEFTTTGRRSSSTGPTQPTTGSLYTVITTAASGSGLPLQKEEVILTICLSTLLAVVILTIVMYNVNKCKRRRAQYSHHPLYASSHEEPGFPNDTLVISGGLYDESRVYNPNMTVLEEDDDLHVDYPAFTSKYSQFKLEFLPEERDVSGQGASFTTFQPET